MVNKYFRLMENPEQSWKPYQDLPMSDDHPELGSYKSTTYVTEPQKGDYLIQSADGSLYVHRPSYPELFDNAEFDAMPSLQDLQKKGIVLEVPADLARKEFYLQEKRSDLALEIQEAEHHMEDLEKDMLQRRFGFPTREARQAKEQYESLKPVVLNMNKQFGELGSQLHWQVFTPLKELQQQKKFVRLDEKISDAAERSKQNQDKAMGLTIRKETSYDR